MLEGMSGQINFDIFFRAIAFRPAFQNWALLTACTILEHPFDYARTLILLGYEPFPPTAVGPSKNGIVENVKTQAYMFPSLFEYLRYIKSVDGWTGCYRGLIPNLVCQSIMFAVANYYHAAVMTAYHQVLVEENVERRLRRTITDLMNNNRAIEEELINNNNDADNMNGNGDHLPVPAQAINNNNAAAGPDQVDIIDDGEDDDGTMYFLTRAIVQLIALYTGVIISHPFHVITVRSMAQFVGRETKYNSVLGSILEIFRNDGILGFFNGVQPRIVGHSIYLLISTGVTYAFRKVFNESLKAQDCSNPFVDALSSFTKHALAQYYSQEYHVESNAMIVQPGGLTLGSPPFNNYDYYSLMSPGQVPIFLRLYSGPYKISNGYLSPSYSFGPVLPKSI